MTSEREPLDEVRWELTLLMHDTGIDVTGMMAKVNTAERQLGAAQADLAEAREQLAAGVERERALVEEATRQRKRFSLWANMLRSAHTDLGKLMSALEEQARDGTPAAGVAEGT